MGSNRVFIRIFAFFAPMYEFDYKMEEDYNEIGSGLHITDI